MLKFIEWAREEYRSKQCPAKVIVTLFGTQAENLKICCDLPKLKKFLKENGGTDAQVRTLDSMFKIYKNQMNM